MDAEEIKKNKIHNVQVEFEKVFDKAKNTRDVEKAYNNLNSNTTKDIVLNKIKDVDYVYNNYKEKLKDEPIYLNSIESKSDYSDISEEINNKATIDDYDGPKLRRIRRLNKINHILVIGLFVIWNIYVYNYLLSEAKYMKPSLSSPATLSVAIVLFLHKNGREMRKNDGHYDPMPAVEIGIGLTIMFWYLMFPTI